MDTQVDDDRGEWTSASAAEYDALCPGRHIAQRGIFEPEASPDAASGTRIHAALALLESKLSGDAFAALNNEEREIAESCWRAEMEAINQFTPDGYGMVIHRENRLWHTLGGEVGQIFKHSGKPDVVYLRDGSASVLDFKTGRGDVAPNNRNAQLRDLAVLVALNHGVKSVTVKIIQPLAPDSPACEYSFADLAVALTEMEDRVRVSNDPTSLRIAGELQCRYCRAKGVCKEFASASLPVPMGETLPTNEQMAVAIKSLPAARLGAFLGLVRLASDCAETEVRERLGAGQNVDGWTLKPGRTRETITDAQGVWTNASAKGVSIEAFMSAVTVTKGGLKDALRTATGAKGRALDQAVAEVCTGCVESKTGNPVLERE